MSDLYGDDILLWSKQQAELLRRMAAGERVDDQVDWPNVIEEIESVGRAELRAVRSALRIAMQHKLYLLASLAERPSGASLGGRGDEPARRGA